MTNKTEIVFANWFIPKDTSNAPDFVKGKVSIKKDEFITFLNEQDWDWVNLDILESKWGKMYAKLNEWKKEEVWDLEKAATPAPDPSQDLPF